MRKILIYFTIIASIITSCISIKWISRTHTYSVTTFSPEKIEKEFLPNVKLTISPVVKATTLDKESYQSALRDGNYQKESISFWKSKPQNTKDKYSDMMRKSFDVIDKLVSDGTIPENIGIELKLRIINENNGYDGTEFKNIVDYNNQFPNSYNPYFMDQKYFSVFKIIFNNQSKNIIKLNINDFTIISGMEQLSPLRFEYFEKYYLNKPEKLKNVYRMNMENEFTLLPDQTIQKYISVPAIDTTNKIIQIKLTYNNQVFDFSFNITNTNFREIIDFQKYVFTNINYDPEYYYFFAVLERNNGYYPLRNNTLYLPKDDPDLPATIYCIMYSQNYLDFGKLENFKFSDYKNHMINIPMYNKYK